MEEECAYRPHLPPLTEPARGLGHCWWEHETSEKPRDPPPSQQQEPLLTAPPLPTLFVYASQPLAHSRGACACWNIGPRRAVAGSAEVYTT